MRTMSVSSPIAPAEVLPEAPRGALRFKGLWLFSARADAAMLLIPLVLAAGAAVCTTLWDIPRAHSLAVWTAQNILGNATHVILTFLLFVTLLFGLVLSEPES